TRVGLRDQKIANVDTELACVHRVERVLGVDIGGRPARFLYLRDDLQRQCRLARSLGSVDLHHAAARQAADAERDVEAQRPGRNHLQVVLDLRIAHLHDRALAELLFDLRERSGEGLVFLVVHGGGIEGHISNLQSMARRPGGREGGLHLVESLHRTIVRCKPPNGLDQRGSALSTSPSRASATVASRTASRSPGKRRETASTLPSRVAHASQTSPTGLSGVPPAGPAMPVTATAMSAWLRSSAPATISRTVASLTAPNCASVSLRMPRSSTLASFEYVTKPQANHSD